MKKLSFEMITKALKIIIIATFLVSFIIPCLYSSARLNFNIIRLLAITVTIFVLTFSISQFLINRISDTISSDVISEYKNNPTLLVFYFYEVALILIYSMLSMLKDVSTIVGWLCISLFILSLCPLIDLTRLYFTYSNPKKYARIKFNKIIDNEVDDKKSITILGDIGNKHILNEQNYIVKDVVEYFYQLLVKFNNDNNRAMIDVILVQLFRLYSTSLRNDSEEISICITDTLYKLYDEETLFYDNDNVKFKFTKSAFLDSFINNSNLNLSRFFIKATGYKTKSLDALISIIITHISIIYNIDKRSNDNYDIYYDKDFLWKMNKIIIDAGRFDIFEEIFRWLPIETIETRSKKEKVKFKLNLKEVNKEYYVIGGYLLYLKDVKKNDQVDKYLNNIWTHNLDKSEIIKTNITPNIFLFRELDMIENIDDHPFWIDTYSINKRVYYLKYYISQFFMLSFVTSTESKITVSTKTSTCINNLLNQKDYLLKAFNEIPIDTFLYNYLKEEITYQGNYPNTKEELKLYMNTILNKKFERLEKLRDEFKRIR